MNFSKANSLGELEDGIYYIKKIKDGYQAKFLYSKLEDLPKAMKASSFEQVRYKIAKCIAFYLAREEYEELTTQEIMDIIQYAYCTYGDKDKCDLK